MTATATAQLPKLQEILDTLELFPDRVDRIQALISISERFEPVPEAVATKPYPESHRVKACESEAYVWALPQGDGTQRYRFAVENPQGVSAMALAVILDDGLSGEPLERVAAVPCDLVYEVFGRELSMGKSMGLMGMVNAVTAEARRALAAAG
ncbi:MAG: SufE family protein [Acidobacteria bacterium]|nr:SufE family protein [Acidobacteriota bacterium]